MEVSLSKLLLDNISSLIRLSSCENLKCEPAMKYLLKIEEMLNLLKPVLDAIVDPEVTSDELLIKAFGELGLSVNESRDLFDSWHPLKSKVCFVMQIEALILKIRFCGLDIFQSLKSFHHHLPSELSSASLELCTQKLKSTGFDKISGLINESIKNQVEGGRPSSETLVKISNCLNLKSNQEILIEAVALEKLKENAEQDENTEEEEYFDQMIALVTHIHDQFITTKLSQSRSPVPIPTDFCCPLSLEPMTDPVIVNSGQTYERAFIKNWMDLGLTVCPKTRQTLAHSTLTPNYTVKALIANWCESNNVELKVPQSIGDPSLATTSPSHSLPRSSFSDGTLSSVNSSVLESSLPPRGEYSEINENVSQSIIGEEEEENIDASNYSCDGPREVITEPVVQRTRSQAIWRRPSPKIVSSSSFPAAEAKHDLSPIESQAQNLIDDLNNTSLDAQRDATAKIRLLAKHSMENRIAIANCGTIILLVNLLHSTDSEIQENAVTALLNLSINNNNKTEITNANAIKPLIHVLETGSPEAKENSAATLFSLSVLEDNKEKIARAGAIGPLVDLLRNGSPRGKKDAASALFNLSLHSDNKGKIVQAGAVKYLVELMDPAAGMVDKAVAVLSNLATIPEGRNVIGQEGGIPVLVEVVELGSARGKENAAAALLQLCTYSNRFCSAVLQEGAVPPLVALSQSGTARGKEKALTLLRYFRTQRHGNTGRG